MFEGHTGLVAATDNTNINILIDKLPRMLPVNQNIWELAQHTEHKSTPLPILQGKSPKHLDSLQDYTTPVFKDILFL